MEGRREGCKVSCMCVCMCMGWRERETREGGKEARERGEERG